MEDKILKKYSEDRCNISDKYMAHSINGEIETAIGNIKRLKTQLVRKDHLDHLKVRFGIHRDNYHVPTGVYAVGTPHKESPILVTANYKLTLDQLRRELKNLNLWILVIDTKGINVWCAAGKGSFSAEEIIYQVKKNQLDELVNHRRLILPQLSAPGVAAHEIFKYTGFKGEFGPIRASDIKSYIENGFKATGEMRRVTFTLKERLLVSPLEFIMSMKHFPIVLILIFLYNLFKTTEGLWISTVMTAFAYVVAIAIVTLVLPALLPLLPFRMFFVKALFLAVVWSGVVYHFRDFFFIYGSSYETLGHLLLMASIMGYLGTNFTGSTTFTSFSGVQRETLRLIPVVAIGVLGGMALLLLDLFI
ncbi:acetyl-CoA synthase subunit gamma [Alkaliphilus serpentinus]|uniref:Acetyl-CoA synthase subunit gamma n=1 Tax=Alkaliphilus serpentinus TaxID=1482731 RepID=A0A833HLP9_9FIRM|nr:acetyl-CoA synthase subunit gamma [Alkaliphilus serpentinus]